MSPNLDEMLPIEVMDDDAFLLFVVENAPIHSLWVIELGYFSPDEEDFLGQFDNLQKIKKTSLFEISLTLENKQHLIVELPNLTCPVHHGVYGNGDAYMVAYDSFSACWISKAVSQENLKRLVDDQIIDAFDSHQAS